MYNVTPENITKLGKTDLFVFGSNELGLHGAGAAKMAREEFGAQMGVGFGLWGQTFAIPTKDWEVKTLPLEVVGVYITRFVAFAKRFLSKGWNFKVTEIGCGLAGFTPEEIAPFFKDCLDMRNVWLPQRFIDVLTKEDDK